MRFAVLGAGAIGGYVGAALARGGAEVTLIARGAHLQAMQRSGVQVRSPRGDFTAHPRATDDMAAVSDSEVVFVALKAYSLAAIAPRLGSLLAPDAAVIWAQNGIPWWYFQSLADAPALTGLDSVDPGGTIASSIDPRHNVGCVVYCSTEIIEPGVIRHVEGTRFTIGEPDGSDSTRCRQISAAFAAGGLRAPVEPSRLRDEIWLKLVGNVAFNPITALTGATMAELGSVPETLELVRAIFAESAAVAARLGVTFPVSLDRRLEAALAVGDHKTSMLQDLEAGKRLEYACMTGAVVELARQLQIDVPHTVAVHACVKLLDQRLAARRAGAG
jgi:2-dehydropantoate 2-reductase